MQYFKDEIDALMTAMQALLTGMATQDREADDVAQTMRERIKDLEAIQANQRLSSAGEYRTRIRENDWRLDRQRMEKLEEYRAADRERIKLLRDRIESLEQSELLVRIESLEQSELTSLHRIKTLEDQWSEALLLGVNTTLEERMKRMHNEIRNGAERMRQLERMVDPNAELPGPDLLG